VERKGRKERRKEGRKEGRKENVSQGTRGQGMKRKNKNCQENRPFQSAIEAS
jgi:hypothetical protein